MVSGSALLLNPMASQNPAIHWTTLAARLNAIAQNGLAFTKDAFDKERFESVRQIAAEIVAAEVGAAAEEVESLLASRWATPLQRSTFAVRSFRRGKFCSFGSAQIKNGRCREVGAMWAKV